MRTGTQLNITHFQRYETHVASAFFIFEQLLRFIEGNVCVCICVYMYGIIYRIPEYTHPNMTVYVCLREGERL